VLIPLNFQQTICFVCSFYNLNIIIETLGLPAAHLEQQIASSIVAYTL